MEAPLAIYEALLQANVSPAAARDAAEKLERDMTTALAIRHDLQQLDARVQVLDTRFEVLETKLEAHRKETEAGFALMDQRFSAQEKRLEARLVLFGENLESRLIIKLGTLMVTLFGLAGGALALLG